MPASAAAPSCCATISATPQGDERCDVAAAAAEIAAESRKAGQRVSVETMPKSLPAIIDRTSFDIVLANLLDNARQHAGPQASVAISGHLVGGAAVVEVRDDGVGISPGNAQRIFDRFFTTKRESGGTGLGLSIARRRVQAFGGELSLEETGQGALFRIRLKPA